MNNATQILYGISLWNRFNSSSLILLIYLLVAISFCHYCANFFTFHDVFQSRNMYCNLKDQEINMICRKIFILTVTWKKTTDVLPLFPWPALKDNSDCVCRKWELASAISFKFTPVTSYLCLCKHRVPGWFASCGNFSSPRLHNNRRGNSHHHPLSESCVLYMCSNFSHFFHICESCKKTCF
jgi:hypothetical protein